MITADKSSVLIVDDERSNILALTHILSPEYTIFAARNGQDALEIAGEYLPDVVLLDILMPEMDGYEVLSRLKNTKETQAIPVIFITGLVEAENEEKGMSLGASDYITKPFSSGIVRLRVQNQMKILAQIKMIKQYSIVENSPHLIIYLSPRGELTYANPAVFGLTGHTNTEIIKGGLELILDAQTIRFIKDTCIPDTLRKGADNCEITMTRKDGHTRTLALTSFTAENGNIGAIAQDVTEMRALEAALVTAKEQAEQSSRAKSEFLSRMSHEMHTPMNAIIGMATIAKNSDDPEKKSDCIEKIDNASRHLLGLIDDVLDVASLEENTMSLNCAEFSFSSMVSEVLKTVRLYTDEKHQTLSCGIDPLIPAAIIADEKRLAQVIRNLLMNASKFTPKQGAIRIDARITSGEGPDLVLQIEVSDNGIGIPKEKQDAIFISFEQADGGFSREYGGAGLGLAISKHIVALMGGRIWVESEPGKGSKFSFTVTAHKTGSADLSDSADEPVQSFEGRTALMAEDVEINREILLAILEDTRLAIDCAENGLQAVEMFAADPGRYDILLMDINMPVVDGWEASRRIRALGTPEAADIPIVAMTANTLQEEIDACYAAGMNDHLGKPIDVNELMHKLNHYLG